MFLRFRIFPRAMVSCTAALAIAALAACGGGDANSGPGPIGATPTPTPSPTPSPVQYIATPVPFGLTEDRDLDIFGWDVWPASPVPSVIQLRWNAAAVEYELSETGNSQFARLRLRAGQDNPTNYDVFAADGSLLPISVSLLAPDSVPPAANFVGSARIFEGNSATAYFAFGIAMPIADIPTSGISTCQFGEDEIGNGSIIFDFTAGTASGQVSPFWDTAGTPTTYSTLTEVKYTPGEIPVLSASYGSDPDNLLEARLYGPQGAQIAVRAKGDVTGIMTGTCSS